MRQSHTHSHRCTTCQQPFYCGGTILDNYDGFPRYPCRVYHEQGETECEACASAEKCDWCGGVGDLITTPDGDRIHEACRAEYGASA